MSSDAPPPYEAATGSNPSPHAPPVENYSKPPYPPMPQHHMPPPPPGYVHTAHVPVNAGMAPPMVGTTTTTVYVGAPAYGPYPNNTMCPKCHAQIVTQTQVRAGLLAWLICGGLVLIGCWLGCCLIPFCVDECQDIDHTCPNCKQFLGSYRRI
uniref:LITAF domain-containing protein n=1 Tax=Plectus sambesii TaxID=2011161 RepID=A0A914XD50_9BILA